MLEKILVNKCKLTMESVKQILAHDIGICGVTDRKSNMLGMTTEAIKYIPRKHIKNRQDVIGKSAYDIFDSDLVDLHRSNNEIVHTGKTWHGFEPCFWHNHYTFIFSNKFPVYNNADQTLIGVFHYGSVIEHTNLLVFLNKIHKHQSMINAQSYDAYEIYQQGMNLHLTPREIECLFYTLRGKTAKEIARFLTISQKTVEFHIEHLKMKFNCYSKSELISKAMECGYLNKIPASVLKGAVL